MTYTFARNRSAFTLIELLVVISVIALLLSILMPALGAVKARARQVVCKSNIRQLVIANTGYATENDGFYVSAASDMWKDFGGYHRWHGVRDNKDEPFDPARGPLIGYLANGKVKECPEKVDFVKGGSWDESFEQGCGGYGYNMTYLGSRDCQGGITTIEAWKEAYARTTRMAEPARPFDTLMFADTAMAMSGEGGPYYIEYSFAEPPYFVSNGHIMKEWGYASPSIHFRHRRCANIGWTDGHISAEVIAGLENVNVYLVESSRMMLGWFEPVDNSSFDLK